MTVPSFDDADVIAIDGLRDVDSAQLALEAAAAGRLQEAIVRCAAPAAIERDAAVLIDELTSFAEHVRQALTATGG